MKPLITFSLLFLMAIAYGQPSDFMVLKRKGKPLQTFYSGSNIEFTTVHGVYKNGTISRIHNDSVYLLEFVIQRIPTTLGTFILDTVGSHRSVYPYADIVAMGARQQKNFNVSGSGAALLGGGILLVLASGVIYLVDRDNFSAGLAGGAAGLAVVGYFLSRAGNKPIVIGKRGYTLEYIDMTP
jgi:hypothetical protein